MVTFFILVYILKFGIFYITVVIKKIYKAQSTKYKWHEYQRFSPVILPIVSIIAGFEEEDEAAPIL
jgi:hypothetical protein